MDSSLPFQKKIRKEAGLDVSSVQLIVKSFISDLRLICKIKKQLDKTKVFDLLY